MRSLRFSLILFGIVLFFTACQDVKNENNENNADNETSSEEPVNDDVEGTLWEGDGNKGIILSHGAAYDADSWEEQGQALADNGLIAFAVEDTSSTELIAAAKMLQDDYDADEVALLGASAGGSSAIDAAGEGDYDFSSVALLSPGGDAMSIDDIPVLVIYSEEEGYAELESDAGESIETVAIPGSAHAQEIFDEDKGDEVMDKLIDFLK